MEQSRITGKLKQTDLITEISLHEISVHIPEPPEVYVNNGKEDMNYEISGEIILKTIGGRSWDILLEENERAIDVVEKTGISCDGKTIKITIEEGKTIVRILFPIRGAQPFRWGGLRWQFHKTDVDPWPSVPHGHCYEKQYVELIR